MKYCSSACCSNSTYKDKINKYADTEINVTFHLFPKDEVLKGKWEKFIRLKSKYFTKALANSCICSNHFERSCFSNYIAVEMGFEKLLKLIPGAVPTIHWISKPKNSINVTTETHDSGSKRKSKALVKRNALKRLESLIKDNATLALVPETTESVLASVSEVDTVADPVELPVYHMCTSMQTDTYETGHKKVQCNIQSHKRSKYTHCCMTVMKHSATQTDVAMDIPYPVQASSPLHSGSSCEYSSDCYEPSMRSSIDTSFNISMPYDVPHPAEEIAIQHERKYIVFKSALEKLFTTCSSCGCVVKAIFLENGTCVNISQLCSECGYQQEWSSQPKIHQTPVGNLLLSAATLFTGCLVGQTMQFLDALNVARISESTFFRHQKEYLHATIENVFSNEQKGIINELKMANLSLNLAGDGRSDSPGHNAKYGSYSVLECQINKVLDIQVVQSTEVANSNACELEGLKRSIEFLEQSGLVIKSLTTDRHTSVSKYLRNEKNHIQHFYDIWHVAKGLKKKLDHLSAKQGGERVNNWKKSIINHLYWCAVSTADGNGDLMLAKWQSILNHLVNRHVGHPSLLFPLCLHGIEYNAENKDWFEPGTDDYESVCKILEHYKLEKDIKKLSPIHQTAALESFHSLVIKFAPKHTAFSYLGMRSRLHIAAMHYNENCGDETDDTDEEGNVRCSIIFPKYKKGDYSIKKQKKSPTQVYVHRLMKYLFTEFSKDPKDLTKSLTEYVDHIPEPLCSHFERPSWDNVKRLSRF